MPQALATFPDHLSERNFLLKNPKKSPSTFDETKTEITLGADAKTEAKCTTSHNPYHWF